MREDRYSHAAYSGGSYFLPSTPNDVDAPTEDEMIAALQRFSTCGRDLEITEVEAMSSP